jgi:hypothetical protein
MSSSPLLLRWARNSLFYRRQHQLEIDMMLEVERARSMRYAQEQRSHGNEAFYHPTFDLPRSHPYNSLHVHDFHQWRDYYDIPWYLEELVRPDELGEPAVLPEDEYDDVVIAQRRAAAMARRERQLRERQPRPAEEVVRGVEGAARDWVLVLMAAQIAVAGLFSAMARRQ